MIVALHTNQLKQKIVCVTDSSIAGKVFSENNVKLDFSSAFYQGQEKTKEEIEQEIKKAYLIIFSGKDSIELGKELHLIDHESVLTVQGVPHAQTLFANQTTD